LGGEYVRSELNPHLKNVFLLDQMYIIMKVYLRLQIRSGTGRLDGLAHGLDDQLVDLDIGRGLNAVADGIGHILGAQQGQVGEVDEGGLIDDLSVHSAGTDAL